MKTFSGRAVGKVILLGEHAVVYGHPALAIPICDRQAEVSLHLDSSSAIRIEAPAIGEAWSSEAARGSRLAPLGTMAREALRLFGAPDRGFTATITSAIPQSAGMGSSAAVSVALARAIAAALAHSLKTEELRELAMAAERGFHGNPSGIDAEVVIREHPILFDRYRGARTLKPAKQPFHFLIANSGERAGGKSTSALVAAVADARRKDTPRYDAIFWEMGWLATAGKAVLEAGTAEQLGMVLTQAHTLLAEIGVSSAKIDKLLWAALSSGAAGAKLSGAGLGGNIVVVLSSSEDEDKVSRALQRAGAVDIIAARLGPAPVEVRT
jgi:mevalonate kinase